jgi:hypothetical protein
MVGVVEIIMAMRRSMRNVLKVAGRSMLGCARDEVVE